ncbi:hypothetical protein M5K25_027486 [Dendrobium thyrsiflorum]|uniref:Aminotransferase-like plant mobile domain-containing protein n=1 Tax=Dendrobium thyrsiflorum TaxID=117978 RepID=A0ABD0TTZ6_DENTH
MGSAQVDSMFPLCWLRWTFYKDSYEQLAPGQFLQHVRAYILFMIGCFLIPDTSRSHVSLQWLPFLLDVDMFGRISIESCVIRVDPHVLKLLAALHYYKCGPGSDCMWAEDRIHELPTGNTMTYRDDFDGLRLSQVSMAPYTKERIDERGRSDLDWTVQYREYLQLWDERRAYVVSKTPPEGTGNQELGIYLRWYRSWASIYLLQPQTDPPKTLFPRSPGERIVADYYIRSSTIVEPLARGHGENAIDQVAELSSRVQRSIYKDYTTFDTTIEERSQTRERGTSSHRVHGARLSTSDAPSRSSGRPHRQSTERETPRLSMYTPSTGYDMNTACHPHNIGPHMLDKKVVLNIFTMARCLNNPQHIHFFP